MLKFLLLQPLLLTFTFLFGQCGYKEIETMSFNVIGGYQSFPPTGDIDQKLTANKFESAKTSPYTFGVEIADVSKKSVFKGQFSVASFYISNEGKRPVLQPVSLNFQYGYDLLQNAPKTYFYPFGGARYVNWSIVGQSIDDKEISAVKNNFDFIAGIGLKQFLNDDLRGAINNFDVNFGISIPLTDGKWKGKDGTDASFIEGSFKNKASFFIQLTFGRAFRPPKA